MEPSRIGIVTIGRNEGERLKRCLTKLSEVAAGVPVVYVDSGSTDGSQTFARSINVQVVQLNTTIPFTAARARNTGVERLLEIAAEIEWIQFLDGDCVLQPEWLPVALNALRANDSLAVVCGRRREIYPEASIYNAMIDVEWDTPIGLAKACGGDALYRRSAFEQVGGFDPTMIAGEEPELCYRLRQAGWQIERIHCEMTLHDANITRFYQWWKRAVRYGWTLAEGAWKYGKTSERYNVRPFIRSTMATLLVPVSIGFALLLNYYFLFALILIPLQFMKNTFRPWRFSPNSRIAACSAATTLICRYAEFLGIVKFFASRLQRRAAEIIEYK